MIFLAAASSRTVMKWDGNMTMPEERTMLHMEGWCRRWGFMVAWGVRLCVTIAVLALLVCYLTWAYCYEHLFVCIAFLSHLGCINWSLFKTT